MFKIDRKRTLSFIGACVLVSSLGLGACGSKKSDENVEVSEVCFQEDDLKYVSIEVADKVAVYTENDVSIIIPFNYSRAFNGFISIATCVKDGSYIYDDYSYSDVIIYDGYDCYNRALKFATAISSQVYLYEDVMNGNPVDLGNYDRIQREMGISK